MPKLKRQPGKWDKLSLMLWAALKLSGMDRDELGARVMQSRSTVYRRLQSPQTMTLEELSRYARALDIPLEELRAVAVVK